MNKKYTQQIPIAWHHVRDARKLVQEALADYGVSVRDAAIMTMSELIENAMKHGDSMPRMPGASFTFTVTDEAVCIEVSNGIESDAGLAGLRACLDAMAKAPDKEALYLGRLQQILEAPTGGSQLGIYRIGFEGGFDLSCAYDDQVVTLTAKRALR